MGTLSAASPNIDVFQNRAELATITVPVAAAMGTIQVEAHIAGIADEVTMTYDVT